MNFWNFASITKKVTLALLGMFLMIFLIMHMGINLCMLREDNGEWFKAAAHFMGTNYIIKVFEVILMATFALHIILAILIQWNNWRARPIGYKSASKSKTSFGSKYMIYTGCLIVVFLGMHFFHFYFVKLDIVDDLYIVKFEDMRLADQSKFNHDSIGAYISAHPRAMETAELDGLTKKQVETFFSKDFKAYEPDFYNSAKILYKQPVYSLIYVFFLIVLGFHLHHAFSSSFQTLGLANKKYTPFVKLLSTVYTILIVGGFCLIPLWFLFAKEKPAPAAPQMEMGPGGPGMPPPPPMGTNMPVQ